MSGSVDERLAKLENDFRDSMDPIDEDEEDYDDDENERRRREDDLTGYRRETFVKTAASVCAIVKESEESNSPDLENIVRRADGILNDAIVCAYQGEYSLFDYIPSFAHDQAKPLPKDKEFGDGIFSRGLLDLVMPIFKDLFDVSRMPQPPPPWKATFRPHPTSTPCSRFRDADKIPPWEATDDNLFATAVHQARCEVSCDDIPMSIEITLSTGGTCLAMPSMGGYKDRTPYLCYYLMHEGTGGGFPPDHTVEIPLANIAYHSTTDELRRLIFVGDQDRVKSYDWGVPNQSGNSPRKPLATHTLKSGKLNGPMAVLPDGRFMRAGTGSIGVWNLDTLETHGPKGKSGIGSTITVGDTWREDDDEIEKSAGSPLNTQIALENSAFKVHKWHAHPSATGVMLCGADEKKDQYYCHAFDLEHGGKIQARYIGHGGSIESFSTSAADPSAFVTGCSDGIARIYDVRHPLPVMTFDNNGGQHNHCPSAIVAHPNGIPFLFTGTEDAQCIKVWDVRAQACIYDLATGNNTVVDMTWDDARNSLYALTECGYVDRMGNHHDYRKAKVPRVPSEDMANDQDAANDQEDDVDVDVDVDVDDDDDDDDDDEDRCWPKRAFHGEDYYGHCFDSGSHRLFRYAFKPDASPDVLPDYGSASMHSGMDYW